MIRKLNFSARTLGMIPFYMFVVTVTTYSVVHRVRPLVTEAPPSVASADCEVICMKYEQCLVELYSRERVNQYSWVVLAGCRNGCSRQKVNIGSCFTEDPPCEKATSCVLGKLNLRL